MATAQPSPLEPPDLPPAPPRRPGPGVAIALAAACGAAFAASHFTGDGLDEATLVAWGAKHRGLILHSRQWWRLVSAGFLHADLIHLLVNLYALVSVGRIVEMLWGHGRFLTLYTVALVGGSAASLAATPGVAVGASGAIFGLFGAVLVFALVHRQHIAPKARVPLLINLAVVLAINVALGLTIPFIDNAAHLGGLAAGAAAALLLRPVTVLGRPGPLVEVLAGLATAVAGLAITVSLAIAVRHARATERRLVIGGELEARTLDRGELTLRVPKGWQYEPPTTPDMPHAFVGRGTGVVAVRVLPPSEAADPPSVAAGIGMGWIKKGGQLTRSRELPVGDQMGTEQLFRHRAHGEWQLTREVVFPTPTGRIVYASFTCLEERYQALEVLFDRVLHSIRVGPPGHHPTPDEQVADDPEDPDAAIALADRYIREGKPERAEFILTKSRDRHPRHAETHNRLALFYATARPPHRKPQEAVRSAKKVCELAPDSPRYLATLALAHEAAGERGEALAAARRAAELAPDDATYADLVRRLAR
ncbi:MAG: rhomboid family intramembrane serine protease [Planctomycetes bacterium]|nr:rhomboid family intramembrane serine protease [Planctomycetota bacterium]